MSAEEFFNKKQGEEKKTKTGEDYNPEIFLKTIARAKLYESYKLKEYDYIRPGTRVGIIDDDIPGVWYKVKYHNKIGYMKVSKFEER